MSSHGQPTGNRLLAALPDSVQRRWLPHLELVSLTLGQVLEMPGSRPTHVHFPTTAVVAQIFGAQDDASIEVALIGNEGLAGSALFLGGETAPGRVVVQCAGAAWRMTAQALLDEFERSPTVRRLLLRYAQALLTQTAQSAWLLKILDRLGRDELPATQDLIAHNLGMRREGVTQSAHNLQRLGLIRYSRGHIRILDREGLERRACECYAVVRGEYERLLPDQLAA